MRSSRLPSVLLLTATFFGCFGDREPEVSEVFEALPCVRVNEDWYDGMSDAQEARAQECGKSVSTHAVRALLREGVDVDKAIASFIDAAESGNIGRMRRLLDRTDRESVGSVPVRVSHAGLG